MLPSIRQAQNTTNNLLNIHTGRAVCEGCQDVGKGTILELTNSQVSLTNVKLSYNNTIYDYLVAKSELNTVLGKE